MEVNDLTLLISSSPLRSGCSALCFYSSFSILKKRDMLWVDHQIVSIGSNLEQSKHFILPHGCIGDPEYLVCFHHDNMKARLVKLNPCLWHSVMTNHRWKRSLPNGAAVFNMGTASQTENSCYFLYHPHVSICPDEPCAPGYLVIS